MTVPKGARLTVPFQQGAANQPLLGHHQATERAPLMPITVPLAGSNGNPAAPFGVPGCDPREGRNAAMTVPKGARLTVPLGRRCC
jgi:hypothetical protein